MRCLFITILFVFCGSAFAQKAGSLDDLSLSSGVDIDAEKASFYQKFGYKILSKVPAGGIINSGRYVITDDFAVGMGQTLTIKDTAIILFEQGKNLFVEGRLIVSGDKKRKVIFANVPARQSYVPVKASDSLWGGIEVGSAGILRLSSLTIKNAKKGFSIMSDNDSVLMQCVDFIGIRQDRLVVGGLEKAPSDTLCLSFSTLIKSKISNGIQPDNRPSKMPVYIWGGLTALAAAGAVASLIINRTYYDKAKTEKSHSAADNYASISDNALTSLCVCGGAFGVCGIGFVWSFGHSGKPKGNQ